MFIKLAVDKQLKKLSQNGLLNHFKQLVLYEYIYKTQTDGQQSSVFYALFISSQ